MAGAVDGMDVGAGAVERLTGDMGLVVTVVVGDKAGDCAGKGAVAGEVTGWSGVGCVGGVGRGVIGGKGGTSGGAFVLDVFVAGAVAGGVSSE